MTGASDPGEQPPIADAAPAAPRRQALRAEQHYAGDPDHRRRRLRRHGRKAYIRSVYFLPSLATLGNAVCGFSAIYVAGLHSGVTGNDPWAQALGRNQYSAAAYLIFLAMIFDALDGRLARFARHTTDFGGQLDSLADVISFGAAPAYLALQVFKFDGPELPFVLSRLIWAIGALYMSCAALRLARFNTANEHGEQHHMSFLGLPSPGAGGFVAAFVLMQQDLKYDGWESLSQVCLYLLPIVVLSAGLLMISHVRYPHLVNRHLRGRRSLAQLVGVLIILLLLVVAHEYVVGIATLLYVTLVLFSHAYVRLTRRGRTTA